MVMLCPTCGHQQASASVKFCSECGVRFGGSGHTAQAEGGKPLIKPLDGSTDSSALAHCVKHKEEKVVGYCGQCGELACVLCLTRKPKQHEACGDLLSLEKFLALSDPFKDQKRRLSQAQQTHQALLQKVQSAKKAAEKTLEDEVAALQDVEAQVLKTLQTNYEAAVAELKAAKEEQRRLVLEATKQKTSELNRSLKTETDDYTRSIGAITAHVQQLSAAEQKLSAPFRAGNMVQQVTANKEGAALLSTDHKAPTAGSKTPAVTPGYTDNVRCLAELRVHIEAGKMEAMPQAASRESAAAKPPQPAPQTAAPTGSLTGPGSTKFFTVGARVVRRPDWDEHTGMVRTWHSDGGRPGTVEEVHRNGDMVRVRWDVSGETFAWYSVGRGGKYRLSLLHPPASQ